MPNLPKTIKNNYDKYISTNNGEYGIAGKSGLFGFKKYECYMLIKYGNAGKFGLANNQEYLIEMPLYPDEVTEQISAKWQQQTVLGRSAALSAYANTDLKSVSFNLDLHRDLLTGSFTHTNSTLKAIDDSDDYLKHQIAGSQKQSAKGPFATRSWYTNMNKMLQISCYPQYTNNGLIPPTTYFIFGQMILKGYVNSYSTTWKKPIINTFYGWNSVQINMDCYPDSIISASNIITNEKTGTASTQNTYNTKFPTTDASKSDVMTRSSTTQRTNARTKSSLGGSVIQT